MESLTFNDFSKGITDSYLRSTPDFSSVLHNFLLDETGSPYTRYGWAALSPRMTVTTASTRPSGLYLGSEPFSNPLYFRADKVYFLNESSAWTEIVGPASNVAVPNKTTAKLESLTTWNKQLIYASDPSTVLPHRIYCTAFGGARAYTALTLGLPAIATPTATPDVAGSTYTYIYAFHYYYEFTDYDGTVYAENGPVTYLTATAGGAIAAGGAADMNLSVLTALVNTSSTNYDVTTAMKIRIGRTVNNGSTFYFLADVNNGTTTYTDATTDALLDDNATMYTEGGVLEYTQPPTGSKFVTQVNNFFWYATTRSLTHSIQGAPGACPAEYIQPTDQQVRGLSSTISFPILLCDQSIYRVDGVFDEFGDGGFDLREIHPTAGCVANRSIVRIPGGLVWAGNGGFYFTDGQQVTKISQSIEDSYKLFKNESITGAFDSLRNIVFWTISSGNADNIAPNDKIIALHLNFGISTSSVFTTLGSENNVYPNCLAYTDSQDVATTYRGKLLIGEARGYLLIDESANFSDDYVDTDVYPTAFKLKTIMYRYESCALDFGTDASRKYCEQLSAVINQQTETAVQFLSRRDDGGAWGTFSEIRKDGALVWGLTEMGWNDSTDARDPGWNSLPIVDGMRHFPAGTLRSMRRQIGLTNSLTWIAKSDDKGTATTDTTFKYVDLNDSAEKWPDDCEDYQILFSGDSYTAFFTVKERISDTRIKVIDPYGTLPSGSTLAWQMRGYRKGERISIESYTVHFSDDSQTMTPSRGTTGLINV